MVYLTYNYMIHLKMGFFPLSGKINAKGNFTIPRGFKLATTSIEPKATSRSMGKKNHLLSFPLLSSIVELKIHALPGERNNIKCLWWLSVPERL